MYQEEDCEPVTTVVVPVDVAVAAVPVVVAVLVLVAVDKVVAETAAADVDAAALHCARYQVWICWRSEAEVQTSAQTVVALE